MPTKLTITGTIYYTVDQDHPDYDSIIGDPTRELSYSDTYTFDIYDPVLNPAGYWTMNQTDAMREHIKHDLALVAGGGYNTKHIHNVRYVFK